MNKSTNIHQLETGILYSLTRGRRKKRPLADQAGAEGGHGYPLPIRKRHNHKYYYITFQNELQVFFVDLLIFCFMNKNILSTLYILNIAIPPKVCYTIITTEEVQSNGKVN